MIGYALGQYIGGRSPVHRLDPRLKVLLTLSLSLLVLGMNTRAGLLISASLIVSGFISRVPLRLWMKSLRPMAFLFALIFLLHALFTPGTPLLPLPFPYLSITAEGFHRGAWIIWRFALLVLGASLLTMTTQPSALVMAMERLLRPLRIFRVPTHDLAMMVSLALRFLPTFLEEIDRTKTAQMARGANFRSRSPVGQVRRIYSLALPLMIRLFRRADEVATAMEGRAYRRGGRTYLQELRWTGLDSKAAILGLGCFALLWFL